ncbi:Uncharacterized protein At4g02000, partial [Linum grandiflorum]
PTAPSPDVADRLRFIKFWIRLLDLPKTICSIAVGKGISSVIGNVLDVGIYDCASEPDYFIRCLVEVDVLQPLYGLREVDLGPGTSAFIRFQYEGLRQVCFPCGRVGHGFRLCPEMDSRPMDIPARNDWMTADRLLYRRIHPKTLQPLTVHPKGGRRHLLADDADSGARRLATPPIMASLSSAPTVPVQVPSSFPVSPSFSYDCPRLAHMGRKLQVNMFWPAHDPLLIGPTEDPLAHLPSSQTPQAPGAAAGPLPSLGPSVDFPPSFRPAPKANQAAGTSMDPTPFKRAKVSLAPCSPMKNSMDSVGSSTWASTDMSGSAPIIDDGGRVIDGSAVAS